MGWDMLTIRVTNGMSLLLIVGVFLRDFCVMTNRMEQNP